MADPVVFETRDSGAETRDKLNDLAARAQVVINNADAVLNAKTDVLQIKGEIDATAATVADDKEAAQEARTGAETAQGVATQARDDAQLYASQAAALTKIYDTEELGRAAVGDGQVFKVAGSGDVAAYEYRRVSSSESVLVAEYPSRASVNDAAARSDAVRTDLDRSGVASYIGSGPVYPIVVDVTGKVLLGYDAEAGAVVGKGVLRANDVAQISKLVLGDYSQAGYVGSGPVYPVMTDKSGRVLLGYDVANGRVIGAGLSESRAYVAPSMEPVDDPIIQKAINHIIAYGQSLSVGAQGKPVLSDSQPYSNVTFQGGPRAFDGANFLWSPFKPLVEDAVSPAPDGSTTRGETICSGMANYATTLRAIDGHRTDDHIILASSAGAGGYRINQLEKGTAWYSNTFLPHITEAHNIESDHAVHVVAWLQGESDAGSETTYETYVSKLNKLVEDINTDIPAITGQTSPVYLLEYQTCVGSAQWRQIQQAQLDVAKMNKRVFMVSPIYHLPHASDGVHLTAVGYKWLGAYFGRAYKTLLDGYKPKWVNPISATLRGRELRVRFDVPVRPLVLDTASLAPTADYGFAVEDGGGLLVISDVSIDGDDVVLTLGADIAGPASVRYAMDHLGDGLTISNAGSGNLRDSAPETITISGVERRLYNVCPHFEMPIVTLGE